MKRWIIFLLVASLWASALIAPAQQVVRRPIVVSTCSTFPCNGVLDDFNRADEGPPPSIKYGNQLLAADGTGCTVVSNQADCGNTMAAWWNLATFGPNSEVRAKLVTAADSELFVRSNDEGTGSVDAITVYVNSTATSIEVWKVVSGAYTQLGGGIAQTVSNGDCLGLEVIGDNATVYLQAACSGGVEQSSNANRSECSSRCGTHWYQGQRGQQEV